MILVAAVALAVVSLKYASDVWQGFIGLAAMLALLYVIAVSIFDRGPGQAFAIGFAVAVIAYGLVVANGERFPNSKQNVELMVSEGRLPTSVLLRSAYQLVTRLVYVDAINGQTMNEEDAQRLLTAASQPGSPTPSIRQEFRPPEEFFMQIGHYWWALLLGYVVGQFARFGHQRRPKDKSARSSE